MFDFGNNTSDAETLRRRLLDEVWGGAMAGFPEMLLDEDEIRQADAEELNSLAQRYGLK